MSFRKHLCLLSRNLSGSISVTSSNLLEKLMEIFICLVFEVTDIEIEQKII